VVAELREVVEDLVYVGESVGPAEQHLSSNVFGYVGACPEARTIREAHKGTVDRVLAASF
jgi:hypothetical protein